MAIQREIWQDHIVGNLFKNNEFLHACVDASHYVLNGSVVHIPQAGALPGVEKNRGTLPAVVSQRTDSDITYTLDNYTTNPILIPHAEQIELSYDKRQSVLSEHEAMLRETIADNILNKWATGTGTNCIRTSGASVPAYISGATGTRKKLVLEDFKRANLALNKMNVPLENRFALFSADMYHQLTDEMGLSDYRDFSLLYDAKDGVLGRVFGFNIMMRTSVVTYTNDTVPSLKAVGAAGAAADNDAVLCWQADSLERALGDVKFFENIDDPTYYGNVYSLSVRTGGRQRYSDGKGIVAIVQAHTA